MNTFEYTPNNLMHCSSGANFCYCNWMSLSFLPAHAQKRSAILPVIVHRFFILRFKSDLGGEKNI